MIKIIMYAVGPLGTNSYLVWDTESGEAMLIDPGGFEPSIVRDISENRLTLKYFVLTHGHYDHVDGVREFKEEYPEAVLAASAKDSELYGGYTPELPLTGGDEIGLGKLSFKVISTPGHTPGGLCFYVNEWDRDLIDRDFSGTLFSGDTLFNASVGRADMEGGDFKALKDSIREELYTLPDDTIVLPGHMDVTTIEREKRYNVFVK